MTTPENPPDSAPDRTPVPPPDSSGEQPGEPRPAPTPEPVPAPVPPPAAARAPAPGPRPGPPRPAPPPSRPAAPAAGPAAAAAPSLPSATEIAARAWGRVDETGTVFVRSGDAERSVGQMPDATPEEALTFFVKRYVDLAFEVDLLEQRVASGSLTPDEASGSVKQVRGTVRNAQAVGDLASLESRLEALTGLIGQQREKRREQRAKKQEQAARDKERIAVAAARVAEGSDWRNGANRMRQLLDEWKALPRLEKSVDDALWRRFSTARTTYTRRRKAHFSELNEQRDGARSVKEKLVVEAEALSSSTEWGPTSGKYRDLMSRWKAAGPAPKGVDDQLWKRFRAAQDAFFGARDASNAELDREFAANAEKKEALLVEAEALVPVTDLRSAKEAFRAIADRWDAAGKVPRERMKDLEGRMRKVEQAIRGTEDDRWRRSNPEARARAADTVAQLETLLSDLEAKRQKAEDAGNAALAREHADAIEARRSWLDQARKALHDFS